jgi:hypothetical protein
MRNFYIKGDERMIGFVVFGLVIVGVIVCRHYKIGIIDFGKKKKVEE